MTDAEQIEAWRSEFESEFDDGSQKYESGIYRNSHRESMWQGFLMARRSQPVIELPEPYDACNTSMFTNEVINAITAAGYKYNVKG